MTSRLALDLSTSTGWALVVDSKVVRYGTLKLALPDLAAYGKYPFNYCRAAQEMAESVMRVFTEVGAEEIVVEETNLGKNRYSQKALEFIHCAVLQKLQHTVPVFYLSSSAWRKALNLSLSAQDKKNNAKLAAAKKKNVESGEKIDKNALGIKGKVTKKHVAIRYVRDTFGIELLAKDDDIADAICLGVASFAADVVFCDGLQKKGNWL